MTGTATIIAYLSKHHNSLPGRKVVDGKIDFEDVRPETVLAAAKASLEHFEAVHGNSAAIHQLTLTISTDNRLKTKRPLSPA